MANEWVKVELRGPNRDGEGTAFTIADGTHVSQGTLLLLTDPRTVTVAGVAPILPTYYAGIAAEEHEADKGVTRINVWTDGIFEAIASKAIVAGEAITGGGRNEITASAALTVASGSNVIGYALENATDEETINVRLKL